MNPRALRRRLASAGYRVTVRRINQALDTGQVIEVPGGHRLLVRPQAGAARELAAFAVHGPAVLVATETEVFLDREQVDDPLPKQRINISIPGEDAAKLRRVAGPNRSVGDAVRLAVAFFLEHHP